MESQRNSKKRLDSEESHQSYQSPTVMKTGTNPYTSNTGRKKHFIINFLKHFHSWNFGTINIRSGKEKSEGSNLYMITKEVAEAKLLFCCLQEVRFIQAKMQLA